MLGRSSAILGISYRGQDQGQARSPTSITDLLNGICAVNVSGVILIKKKNAMVMITKRLGTRLGQGQVDVSRQVSQT